MYSIFISGLEEMVRFSVYFTHFLPFGFAILRLRSRGILVFGFSHFAIFSSVNFVLLTYY